MLGTFKDYLITEKVSQAEYEEILGSAKYRVGMEFEYIDNEVLRATAGEFDFDMLWKGYKKFIHNVETSRLEAAEIREKWLEEQRTTIQKRITELQGEDGDEDEIDTLKDAMKGDEDFFELDGFEGLDDLVHEFDLFEEEPYFQVPEIPDALIDFWAEVVTDEKTHAQPEEKDIREAITQAVHEALFDTESDFDADIMPKAYNMVDFQHFDPTQVQPSKESIESGFNFEDFPYKNYVIGGYNENQHVLNKWRIETDESLSPRAGGMEVVSPITDLRDTLTIVKQMFDFINSNGYTNESCGLHANMSFKGYDLKELDVFKMMIFMEEGFIWQHFPDRNVASEYLRFTYQVIAGNTSINSDMLKDFNKADIAKAKTIIKNSQDNILKWMQVAPNKVNGINVLSQRGSAAKKFRDGRIEFRYIGGKDYSKKYTQVRLQLLRYAFLLKLGMDPNFKKKEYISKVSRMIENYGEHFPKNVRAERLADLELLVTDTENNDVYMVNQDDDSDTIMQYSTDSVGKKKLIGKITPNMLKVRMKTQPDRYQMYRG